ncbi:MAG: HD domain-containing protein [Oscillospiraceae bacterium]|nr:HD domain-containing protein [Oscillospiraceae bacterium]
MDRKTYQKIEAYMRSCMTDSAHDRDHVYRVLYLALDIAARESDVDFDILIPACLLHDIGRAEQFENPKLDHAQVGREKAYKWLRENGWPESSAVHISECVLTHRYRNDNPPASLEAKILFDSDKLDVTGTLGIARTIFYKGQVSEPLYTLRDDGSVSDGSDDTPSFFQEYKFKLENIYDRFYTDRAKEIAAERQKSAISFYNSMLSEVAVCYQNRGLIEGLLE